MCGKIEQPRRPHTHAKPPRSKQTTPYPSALPQHALHATPAAAPFLALAAAACLAIILPLVVYCGTASEFGTDVHPLTPSGYKKVFLRTYAAAHAARGAGGRVHGKDL